MANILLYIHKSRFTAYEVFLVYFMALLIKYIFFIIISTILLHMIENNSYDQ